MIANVIGMGARGPLGLTSLQVATGFLAGGFAPRSLAQRDRSGHPMGVAVAGGPGDGATGHDRLVALGAPALAEAVAEAGAGGRDESVPLLLCLAEPGRADDDPRFEREVLATLGARAGVTVDPDRSRAVRLGHAGFGRALREARVLLEAGCPRVVVGGVDSYYHAGVLRALDAAYRLHGLETEDGFIPSEAAGFLVLERPTERLREQDRGRIRAVEVGDETAARDESVVNLATAMTGLVERVLAAVGTVERVYTDENGESFRRAEWSHVSLRLLHGVPTTKWVWGAGDVGAAAGPLYAATILRLAAIGALAETRALLALHSDGGERAAIALEANHG